VQCVKEEEQSETESLTGQHTTILTDQPLRSATPFSQASTYIVVQTFYYHLFGCKFDISFATGNFEIFTSVFTTTTFFGGKKNIKEIL
jgi:hypothetical protein